MTTNPLSEAAFANIVNELLELTKLQTAALDDSDFHRLRMLTEQKQTAFDRLEPVLSKRHTLTVEMRRQVRRLLTMEKYNLRLGLWREQECGVSITKLIGTRAALGHYAVAAERPHAVDEER